jgi:molybdate transport system substrate-binding protein
MATMRVLFRSRLCLLVVAVVTLAPVPTAPAIAAEPAPRVAAASSLNFALQDIAAQFQRERGETVQLVFGASGALTRQIEEGAPFELFLAADEEYPERLAQRGLTRDQGVVYAVGRLVLFAPTGSPLPVDQRLDGLARLVASGKVSRFAIANPSVAPYGRAAEAVLRQRGLWEPMQGSLVFGDTIAQAAQFATSGNAIGGLIAYSLVLSPALSNRGTFAVLPSTAHEPLRQRMVRLKRASAIADHFYAYMQGPVAGATLRKYGFDIPQ